MRHRRKKSQKQEKGPRKHERKKDKKFENYDDSI